MRIADACGMATTPLLIRAAARGGKFLGTDAGGADFWIYNVTTGETYASQQNVNGDSGPAAMMTTPLLRDTPLPVDSGTAGFFRQIDIDQPSRLYILVVGPVKYPDQSTYVSTAITVLPGQGTGDPTNGDTGLVIDIPGICINIQDYQYDPSTLLFNVTAAVMMMCGCKVGTILNNISPWPPGDFNVELVIGYSDGQQSYTLVYSGQPSIYNFSQALPSTPLWAMITVSQISMGQSGACTVFGDSPAAMKARVELPEWAKR